MRVFDAQAAHTFTYVTTISGSAQAERGQERHHRAIVRYFYSMNGVIIGDVGTDKVKSAWTTRSARRLR